MQVLTWFRSYVERLLEDAWQQGRVEADDDGDYPFRYGSAACFVRIEPGPPLRLRVVACAAVGVRSSAKLLAELNDLNVHAAWVTAYWSEGRVLIDRALPADVVDHESLLHACADVGQTAHDTGPLLAGMFDGRTPFPAAESVDEESG